MLSNVIRRAKTVKNTVPILSTVRGKAAYEGEGKTVVKVINQDYDLGLMIDSYATYGFKLNNGLTVLGPMAIFPRTVLSWQVDGAENITEETLSLFKLLEPKVDLLVLGLDSKELPVLNKVFRVTKNAGLNAEILATEHACSTFNFLNAEGRAVAAALLPPLTITNMSEDDMLAHKLHYHDVFNASKN
ncbi:unnamed protein product [Arctia plantaginis]|uniref:NADH dehydrogenase [ubiquinone] 1 alpha subcomplex assembly factor 3 n=1 Tax=Arctia plantaginis TaxID=874455 RepID=A0A8S0ZL26_ARCPL|nr:unnamed protein product [Arctia plantaginis]CAB3254420.1 unnamed protein product [Arctia plantaginis]